MIIGFGKEGGNSVLQKYAANKLYSCLSLPHVHETLVMIGSFVVAEFADYLVESGKEP
jgi:AP-2 complex subunit alpha